MTETIYDRYRETYAETTSRNGNRYWFFIGWNEMPDLSEAAKVTKKFAYFDTPMGREKYRL